MAAIDLNSVRATIEGRLATELASSPAISVVFSNMAFDSTTQDTFVTCEVSFSANQYSLLAYNSSATNNVIGLVTINIFTEEGIGSGANFTVGERIRNLYNRVTVSNVIFDSPIGPEVLTSSPEGKFQTQIRITFNIYEDL